MKRSELTELIIEAKMAKGLSWQDLADKMSMPVVWTIAALMGQHPMNGQHAQEICDLLDIDPSCRHLLMRTAMRGSLPTSVPTDPTIYRFYEALQVYGPAIKEVINEKFGDGIMSAINFSLSVDKKLDPAGDRVVVTMSGKFLPYEWKE